MGFSRQEYRSGLPLPTLESSPLSRDQTCVPCTGSPESQSVDHQGSPSTVLCCLVAVVGPGAPRSCHRLRCTPLFWLLKSGGGEESLYLCWSPLGAFDFTPNTSVTKAHTLNDVMSWQARNWWISPKCHEVHSCNLTEKMTRMNDMIWGEGQSNGWMYTKQKCMCEWVMPKGTSLVVQWLRTHLPMQGAQVPSHPWSGN